MTDINQTRAQFFEDISRINLQFNTQEKGEKILRDIEQVRVQFLGKNGHVTNLMANISSITDIEQKKAFGQQINQIKGLIDEQIKSLHDNTKNILLKIKLENDRIDITLPPRMHGLGSIHPMTKMMQELKLAG